MATDDPARNQSRSRGAATGLWRDAFGRLRKNRLAMVGLVIVILFLFFGDLRAVPRAVPVPGAGPARRSSTTAAGRCRR